MTGEFALIDRLSRLLAGAGGRVLVGHGDDAAVLDLSEDAAVLAVDALVEGRHWHSALSTLADVGWKAIAVNASDIAAMGAEPVAAVVALQRPESLAADEVELLYEGMAAAAQTYGLALVGGDTVAGDVLAVSVTVLGRVAPGRAVLRSGARPGDVLLCIGPLGAAAAGFAQALASGHPDPDAADSALLAAHRRPRALVAAGRALAAAGAHAMIDVSDGIGADVAHLCRASGVAARLRARDLPVADGVAAAASGLGVDALDFVSGGEDFALVAAVPAERADEALARATESEQVVGAIIGVVVEAGGPLVVLETDTGPVDWSTRGFDHYAPEPEA